MFTGIVTDVGRIAAATDANWGRRFRIETQYDADTIEIGASIACSGPCLTVVEKGHGTSARGWFDVEATSESLARTTAGDWQVGTRINIERSLKAGDELGGHLVSGHVDATAAITDRRDDGDTAVFAFEAPHDLARFIAEKGAVALDGTSLTVNDVSGDRFSVMIIPHTLQVTTWAERRPGDRVNLEVDQIARYLDRLTKA